MSESTASNLLNKTKNWQKPTSWLFKKRGGVEFPTTEDKTRSLGSQRDLIPLHKHAKPNAMSTGSRIYFLVSLQIQTNGKRGKRMRKRYRQFFSSALIIPANGTVYPPPPPRRYLWCCASAYGYGQLKMF